MKNKITNLKLVFISLSTLFLAVASCDSPASNPSPSVGGDESAATYNYKAALVGSSGNMEIEIKPDGTGKVVVTLDGVTYTLTPEDGALSNFKEGDALDNVKFTDSQGNIVTISTDANGKNPQITVTIPSHDGAIGVVAFEATEATASQVAVYEGMETVSYKNEEGYNSKQTFNIVLKGEKFEGMRKLTEVSSTSCADADTNTDLPDKISGSFTRDGDKAAISFESHGTTVKLTATFVGDKIVGDDLTLSSCKKTKVLDPAKAYKLGDAVDENGAPLMGYFFTDDTADEVPYLPCGHGVCPAIPDGKKVKDEQGNEITADNDAYFTEGTEEVTVISKWEATKTL